jgi:hypothetical protein
MNIREYITEQLDNVVLESIGSQRLTELFSKNRNGKVFIPRYIDNELQWDKITDSDIEEWSTEQARKLAYKKGEDYYILWVDGSGALLGRTIGNWHVYSVNHWRGKPEYGTAKAMSLASDKAYVIMDWNKFSTRELRAARQEQKKDALALKKNAEIAKENIERYKAIISERRLQEINFGDVVDSVKNVTENYAYLIGAINDDVVCSPDFKETVKMLEDLEESYHKIMDVFKSVLEKFRQYDDWKKYANDNMVEYARREILKGVNTLQTQIDKFNEKYIPDEAQ